MLSVFMSGRGAPSLEEFSFGASLEDLFGFELVDASGSQISRQTRAKAKAAPSTGIRYHAVSKVSVKALTVASLFQASIALLGNRCILLCEAKNFSGQVWNARDSRNSGTL